MYYKKFIVKTIAYILCLSMVLSLAPYNAYALRPAAVKSSSAGDNAMPYDDFIKKALSGDVELKKGVSVEISDVIKARIRLEERVFVELDKNIERLRENLKQEESIPPHEHLAGPDDLKEHIRNYQQDFDSICKRANKILDDNELDKLKKGVDSIVKWYLRMPSEISHLLNDFLEEIQSGKDRLREEEMDKFIVAVVKSYNFALEFEERVKATIAYIRESVHPEEGQEYEEEQEDQAYKEGVDGKCDVILDRISELDERLTFDVALLLARTKSRRAKYILLHLHKTLTNIEDKPKREDVIRILVYNYHEQHDPRVLSVCIGQLETYGHEPASEIALRKLASHLGSQAIRKVVFDYLRRCAIEELEVVEFIIRRLPFSEIPGWLKKRIRYFAESDSSLKKLKELGVKDPDKVLERIIMIYKHLAFRGAGKLEKEIESMAVYETDEFVLRPIHSYGELDYFTKKTLLDRIAEADISIWDSYYVLVDKASGLILAGMVFTTSYDWMRESKYHLGGPVIIKDMDDDRLKKVKEALSAGAKNIISYNLRKVIADYLTAHGIDKDGLKFNPLQQEHVFRAISTSA